MPEPLLLHGNDSEGRPCAAPLPDDHRPEMAGLARFLTKEVHWPHYADLLLEHAAQTRTGQASLVTATGNAYAVTFEGQRVTIEHLHLPGLAPTVVPAERFERVLRDWHRHLTGG